MPSILRIGSEFAGYRIDALLGRGGMSEVYRAENPRLGNKIALKLLTRELAEDQVFRERFLRESRIAASLDHPNVVPIFDAGEAEGLPYIAMRYVEGPDLKNLIDEQSPLPPERVVNILYQVAGALDAAHARGLIHRDVKPANILIDIQEDDEQADHVYLSDFGVAKHSLSRSGLTLTGQFVGTIDYVAPEQIEGKDVDGRTDVYSLGCVLFESLAGSPPYDRDSNVAMMYAHLLDSPPSLADRRPELPAELDEVIAKALAKSRDERYSTCRALIADAGATVGVGRSVTPATIPARAVDLARLGGSTTSGSIAAAAAATAGNGADGTVLSELDETVTSGTTPAREPRTPPLPLEREPVPGNGASRTAWRSRRVLVAGAAALVLAGGGAMAAAALMGGSSKEPTAPNSSTRAGANTKSTGSNLGAITEGGDSATAETRNERRATRTGPNRAGKPKNHKPVQKPATTKKPTGRRRGVNTTSSGTTTARRRGAAQPTATTSTTDRRRGVTTPSSGSTGGSTDRRRGASSSSSSGSTSSSSSSSSRRRGTTSP